MVIRFVPALVAAALLALAVAACGGGSKPAEQAAAPPPPPAPPSPFAYDRSRPLAPRVVERHGIVREVTYAVPGSRRARAVLVVPRGQGPFPAVLYLHGAGGSRHDFLPDADALARRGFAALLVESAWVDAAFPGVAGMAAVRRFRDLEAATVVRLRRGVDLLRSLPEVDDRRLGFVGWSAGARAGAIFAGVEPRVRAFVLIAGGAAPVSAYLTGAPTPLRPELQRLLETVDPLHWVSAARPGTIFFQDGLRDEVVPRDALERLAAAAPAPQRVRWYPAEHRPTPAMVRERNAWLAARLGSR
jgi:dienelactone hydrolase